MGHHVGGSMLLKIPRCPNQVILRVDQQYNEHLEAEEVVLCDLIVVFVRVQDDRKSEPRVGAIAPPKLLLLRGLGWGRYSYDVYNMVVTLQGDTEER